MEKSWKDPSAPIAMSAVKNHMDKMECYGCHVKVDYSRDKDGKQPSGIDWIASGNARKKNGQTAESVLGTGGIKSMGKPYETRSYLRWEDPVLGISGEGRVTPLMPGCQVTYTVINEGGKTLVNNMIAESPDEAAQRKQKHIPLAIDMAPVQPHTAQRRARTCEFWHTNKKSAGLGWKAGISAAGFRTRSGRHANGPDNRPPAHKTRTPDVVVAENRPRCQVFFIFVVNFSCFL